MKRYEAQRDIDELNEFYASLAKQSEQPKTKLPKLLNRLKVISHKKALPSAKNHLSSSRKQTHSSSIQSFAPSKSHKKSVSKTGQTTNKKLTVQTWVKNLDPMWLPWLKLAIALTIIFVILLLTWAGIAIYKRITRAEPPPEDLAPSVVYVPHNLPDGFSIGSGAQKLENGAQFYTVYDNKGHAITISQQSMPTNFNVSIFGESPGFDTPLGKGYVVNSDDRTTGYVMAEKTMLLFNTVPDIELETLQDLMIAFEP